jgi:hypothetical protein
MTNMQYILTKLVTFVVVDGSAYVSFNVIYHNWMNSNIKKLFFELGSLFGHPTV